MFLLMVGVMMTSCKSFMWKCFNKWGCESREETREGVGWVGLKTVCKKNRVPRMKL